MIALLDMTPAALWIGGTIILWGDRMKWMTCLAAIAAGSMMAPVCAQAQDDSAAQTVSTEAAATTATPECELHVWPTENYLGINSGLLSGFGVVGALADMSAHANRVKTVKDLMRDYLGPDVQLAELSRLGLLKMLKLPDKYAVIIEDPTPFNEDLKENPALKAKVKELNQRIKTGQRLSVSTNPCYAELVTTHIFYHKAMMYGSNLFTGWIYRELNGPKAGLVATGQVKNPLEQFPPKTAETIDAAKVELRDAYAKDFAEYVAKKVGR